MVISDPLIAQVNQIDGVIRARGNNQKRLERYYDGDCPIPRAIERAKWVNSYRVLMGVATAAWGSPIVDCVLDRLEVTGVQSGDASIDEKLWSIWQGNQLDAEFKLALRTILISGRAFALVWPDVDTGEPVITFDEQSQMCVKYMEGSRRQRVAALRRWCDDDGMEYATLYRPEAIYKYEAKGAPGMRGADGLEWQPRTSDGEDWIVENPFGVVPVVELAVNRRLRPGCWGHARGEYEHCTDLIDRINLLTFLGLIVAFWQGYPLRYLIGEVVARDDSGEPIKPFDVGADHVVQIENENAKMGQLDSADRMNLSIYPELDQLATITKTPRHYFPLAAGLVNVGVDTIRAFEGTMVAKIPSHKASLGEGGEEILRLAGAMSNPPIILPSKAELTWTDHETRSLSERADAATKLKDILPRQAVMEYVLNATSEQMSRWEAEEIASSFKALVSQSLSGNAPSPDAIPSSG